MHGKQHVPNNSGRGKELREYMKSKGLDIRITENVRDITRVILNQDSPEVRAAKGHYIYQPTGKTHYIGEMLVKIDERKYMVLFSECLKLTHGRVTLEMKQTFEGNIAELERNIAECKGNIAECEKKKQNLKESV